MPFSRTPLAGHSLDRRRFSGWLAALAGAGSAGPLMSQAHANAWPTRAITLIAPYPAGGGIDTVARMVGERLAPRLGQAIAVDNRPGAGGMIGGAALVRATPDGYTQMLGSIVDYAIAPMVNKSVTLDVQRDMVPVVEIGYGTVGLIVNADLPVKNLQELIALAKTKPGSLSFASSGTGGQQHLNAEMFQQLADVRMVHVPYKGSSQFVPDLIAGRIPMSIDSIPPHLPNVRSGKLRVLAVAGTSRIAALPDVPTMAEAGLPGYETSTNYTLFVPAKTPAAIVAQINREVNALLTQPDLVEKLGTLGISVRGGTSVAAQARVAAEVAKWDGVIRKGRLDFS